MPRTKKARTKSAASRKTTGSNIVQLPISKLRFAKYQESRKKSAVAWMRKQRRQFDAAKLGVIDVSYRDGKYWVVDGMARTLLVKEMRGTTIWAVVNRGLTYEEEAKRFVVLNKERRKTTAFQEFVGEYEAKTPGVVAAVRIAQKYGFEILEETTGSHVIRCHSQVRTILKGAKGLETWDRTLFVLHSCWKGLPGALQNDLVRGMACFVRSHGDVEGVLERLVQVLSAVNPDSVQGEAYLKRKSHSGNGVYRMTYLVLLDLYNRGLSRKKRLVSAFSTTVVTVPRERPRKAPPKSAPKALDDAFVQGLRARFQRGLRGGDFLFRSGGEVTLANRLHAFLAGRAAEAVVGRRVADLVRAYMRLRRKRFSPLFAQECETLGIKYEDVLVPKKAPAKRAAKKAPAKRAAKKAPAKKGNGHGGEVIFDATSLSAALPELN
jgi:hypothetical protein